MASTLQTRLEHHFLPVANRSPTKRQAEGSTVASLISNSSASANELSVPRPEHVLRVYVLCGVVGSGKSNLASQWEAIYPDSYTRICQDVLGNRRKCEDAARQSVHKGKSPIIDRQNFEPAQRYPWLEIAHEAQVEVVALVFQTSTDDCARRLKIRRNHETVKTPQQGLQILGQISNVWSPPYIGEGFHRIVRLPADLPLRFSTDGINAILLLVDETPSTAAILPPRPESTNAPSRGGPRWHRPNSISRPVRTDQGLQTWLTGRPNASNAHIILGPQGEVAAPRATASPTSPAQVYALD